VTIEIAVASFRTPRLASQLCALERRTVSMAQKWL
jgi:hypothetical protein